MGDQWTQRSQRQEERKWALKDVQAEAEENDQSDVDEEENESGKSGSDSRSGHSNSWSDSDHEPDTNFGPHGGQHEGNDEDSELEPEDYDDQDQEPRHTSGRQSNSGKGCKEEEYHADMDGKPANGVDGCEPNLQDLQPRMSITVDVPGMAASARGLYEIFGSDTDTLDPESKENQVMPQCGELVLITDTAEKAAGQNHVE